MPIIFEDSVFLACCMGDKDDSTEIGTMQRIAEDGCVRVSHSVSRSRASR